MSDIGPFFHGTAMDAPRFDVGAPSIFTRTLEVDTICSGWTGSLLRERSADLSFTGESLPSPSTGRSDPKRWQLDATCCVLTLRVLRCTPFTAYHRSVHTTPEYGPPYILLPAPITPFPSVSSDAPDCLEKFNPASVPVPTTMLATLFSQASRLAPVPVAPTPKFQYTFRPSSMRCLRPK